MTREAWLSRHGMPVSKVRKIVRGMGCRVCLRCLSRPVVRGKRCEFCRERRRLDNVGRKR